MAQINYVWKDLEYMIQLSLMDEDPESMDDYDIPGFQQIQKRHLKSCGI